MTTTTPPEDAPAPVLEELIGPACYARGCTRRPSHPDYLMCVEHWALVPLAVQRRVIGAVGIWKRTRSPGTRAKLWRAIRYARQFVNAAERRAAARARMES